MTPKTSKLRDAISFAIALGVTAPGLAMAQEAQSQTASSQQASDLDTITVTGTRIQSQAVTSTSPVAEIEKEEFQYAGATRTEDLVNQMPQMSPAFDSFTNNGATGYPTVDLRGLGAQRTLTLVNGFRLPPGAFEVTDISIVPAAAIRRVDLLTGGASAVYGSDAIAGVVNFVLDDEFEGVSLTAGYSAYQHENDNDYMQGLQEARGFDYPTGDSGFDGASRNIDLVLGSRFADDRGHAMAWATWRKNDPLFQGQRDYASCALNDPGTACGGSATNAGGNFYAYQFDADGNFVPGTSASQLPDGSFIDSYGAPYNFAPINYYQRPDERYTFGTTIKYEINEHFKPYFDAMFINKRDSIQIAESGAFFSLLENQDCANPIFGSFCSDLGLDPTQPVNIYVAKRNVEGGPRRTDTENTQWRVVAGLEGALDENWSYNASFLHGRTSNDVQGYNDFLNDRIVSAILGCPDGSFAGCIPYNVFQPNGVTPEAAAALAGVSMLKTATELTSVNAYVTGDTGLALPWTGNTVSLVMGGEWRETKYDFVADSESQAGNFAGAGGPAIPVGGMSRVTEVFLESIVPLIDEGDVLKAMDLELGYRLSDYDLSGTASTWKVGLGANFADQFRVRTGFNRAIRAPSVVNLFAPQQIALFTGSDPCGGPTPVFTLAQCQNTGLTAAQYGNVPVNPSSQLNQFIGGNPNLEPESAETFTLGVVWTPTENSRFSVDYYDIELGDRIGTVGAATILAFCAQTGDPFLCDRVNRNPQSGDLWRGSDPTTAGHVENLTANFGEIRYRGLDFGAMYRFDLGPGRLTTNFQGNYSLEQEFNPLPGVNEDAIYDCAGKINISCQSPEWRHIANVRYSIEDYSANLRWRYFGKMDYENTDGTPGTVDQVIGDGIGGTSYIDLSGSAFIGEYTELTIGVNNIADKEPPLVGATLTLNGNSPGGYDQAGRFFFGSVTFRF